MVRYTPNTTIMPQGNGLNMNTQFNPLLPTTRPGKRRKPNVLTPADVRHKVDDLVQADFSNVRSVVLESLYSFGVLTETALFRLVRSQIAISDKLASFSRTLRRYRSTGLIILVSYEVMKKTKRAGLPMPDDRTVLGYTLGPVGEEYAKRKGWNGQNPFQPVPDDDYQAHDLICAETMFRMQQLWSEMPEEKRGLVEVYGPRQVAVWDVNNGKAIAAPDGLLIKRNMSGTIERTFLVEYHNVNNMLHVQAKISRYEELAKPEYHWIWKDMWGLDEMPWVLVIYRQGATLQHYQQHLEARGETLAKYACTSLDDIWAGKLSIKPIRKQP
jgi:hypothetical protein